MRRRALFASLTAAVLTPASVRAQQNAMPVIGSLNGASFSPINVPNNAAFQAGLAETGFVVGQNVMHERVSADGHYERLPAMAAAFVQRKVNVITTSGLPEARAAKEATSTIPIVFASGLDPVANGLVASLGRPGGNLTGVSILNVELIPKRFELLCDLVPHAGVIAMLVNPKNSNTAFTTQDVQEAARRQGRQVDVLTASTEDEIDAAFADLVQRHDGALLVGTDPFLASRRDQIVALTARHAVPAIFGFRTDSGLISYGTSLTAVYRQLGIYAGSILKGAKPADLPVLQPTTFEIVINMKTAKALGIIIPPSILARADEVIE